MITTLQVESSSQSGEQMDGETGYRFGCRNEYSVRVAASAEDRRRAWALAYEVYREKGYAFPNRQKLWYSIFDALPETVTLLIERATELHAAVTVIPDSPLGLPADAIFPEQMRQCRRWGARPAEAVSLVQREYACRSDMAVAIKLCELSCLIAKRLQGATDGVITVNPKHQAYYQSMMLFEPHGEWADYDKVGGAPAVFLTLNFDDMNRYVREACEGRKGRTVYRRFLKPAQAQAVANRFATQIRPLDEDTLRRYFVDERPILTQARPEAQRYILDRLLSAQRARHSTGGTRSPRLAHVPVLLHP